MQHHHSDFHVKKGVQKPFEGGTYLAVTKYIAKEEGKLPGGFGNIFFVLSFQVYNKNVQALQELKAHRRHCSTRGVCETVIVLRFQAYTVLSFEKSDGWETGNLRELVIGYKAFHL